MEEEIKYIYPIFCGSLNAMKMIKEKGAKALNPKTMRFQLIDKEAKYDIRIDNGEIKSATLMSDRDLVKIAKTKGLIL